MSEKSSFETFLKWAVVVIVAIAALKVVMAVLGIAWVLGAFLLFRVLPLVLVVWGIVRLVKWLNGDRGSPAGTSTY
jgi:uncharacterized MAPEG superfamily protein